MRSEFEIMKEKYKQEPFAQDCLDKINSSELTYEEAFWFVMEQLNVCEDLLILKKLGGK